MGNNLISSQKFRSDINFLRGLAALLVLLYHAQIPGFSGGFIGVDVFLVITGYLMAKMFSDFDDGNKLQKVSSFYKKKKMSRPMTSTAKKYFQRLFYW